MTFSRTNHRAAGCHQGYRPTMLKRGTPSIYAYNGSGYFLSKSQLASYLLWQLPNAALSLAEFR